MQKDLMKETDIMEEPDFASIEFDISFRGVLYCKCPSFLFWASVLSFIERQLTTFIAGQNWYYQAPPTRMH